MVEDEVIGVGKTTLLLLALLTAFTPTLSHADSAEEKVVVICTTNVLGSVVEQLAGDRVELVVLSRPGICPADYDIKPGDIYAVSRARLLFYHGIKGEHWLPRLLEASGNKQVRMVKIPGAWNTHQGARRYIEWVAGNLSLELGEDFSKRAEGLLKELDEVAREVKEEAEALKVEEVKVMCMKWQRPFVSWVGFNVVADYDPPETIPARKAAELSRLAREEGVALFIDNLQVGVEFGRRLAEETGGEHVVLTNFPGAVPGTETLAKMLKYNADRLFEALRSWRAAKGLKLRLEELSAQLALTQAVLTVVSVVAVLEAVLIYSARRRRAGG